MHATREAIIRRAMKHVAVRGIAVELVRQQAEAHWQTVLSEPVGFQAAQLARIIARAVGTPVQASGTLQMASVKPAYRPKWTLSDLADPAKLAEWLNYDGEPPTVTRETAESRLRNGWHNTKANETVPVNDAETASQWLREYRHELAIEWQKSAANPYKKQTDGQFMMECLSSMGYKRGTVAERKAKAIADHPEIYSA